MRGLDRCLGTVSVHLALDQKVVQQTLRVIMVLLGSGNKTRAVPAGVHALAGQTDEQITPFE